MRVRIRKASSGVIDGVSLAHLQPGGVYNVNDSLGNYLIAAGLAESPIADVQALSEPDDLEKALGGVTVTQIDHAADKVSSTRTDRRTMPGDRRRTSRTDRRFSS